MPGTAVDGTIIGMSSRPLTERERAVLEALLAVDFPGVEALRREAADALVVGTCGCGCPSIDFNRGQGGMTVRVNASVRGSHEGLFLYTLEGEVLGGIEWMSVEETDPAELPPPEVLDIGAA